MKETAMRPVSKSTGECWHFSLALRCWLSLLAFLFSKNTYFIPFPEPLPRHISAFPPFFLIKTHMMFFLCFYVSVILLCCRILHVSLSYLLPSPLSDNEMLRSMTPVHICLRICDTSWYSLHKSVTFTILWKSFSKFSSNFTSLD